MALSSLGHFLPVLCMFAFSLINDLIWPFHEDGTESKKGRPCLFQSQSKGFEGKESRAERHPQPQKKKRSTRHLLKAQDTVAQKVAQVSSEEHPQEKQA